MSNNKNIYLLPTNKPSKIAKYLLDIKIDNNFFADKNGYSFSNECFQTGWSNIWQKQNIYITSDEEIKKGDWYTVFDVVGRCSIYQCIKREKDRVYYRELASDDANLIKKIILTTDQDLIKDSVQAIDDEFFKWFVKNPSCEYIKTEKWLDDEGEVLYSRIIPKEESKQETLEEVAENHAIDKQNENISKYYIALESFQKGAKWQQEKSYSEEDLREAFRQGELNINYSEMYGLDSELTEQQWFEQFKKK